MGIAERRERERAALRKSIIEAARDIVLEQGLDALSMRSIAERIEYSPATIYLYFRDKDELLGEVVHAGFKRLGEYIYEELAKLDSDASPVSQHRALGRSYARFALENTAYFRVMFELPTVPQIIGSNDCVAPPGTRTGRVQLEETIQRAIDEGLYSIQDAETGAIICWGLLHGLTSLYLSGHLPLKSHEEFMVLVETAMDTLVL